MLNKISFKNFLLFIVLASCFSMLAYSQTTTIHEYVPGSSSYSLQEGVSPNSIYFSTNTEKVDPARGTLFIERTDLSFKGPGIGFNLKSQFSSDRYYYTYKSSVANWEYNSELEKESMYKICRGWRWELPAFRFKDNYGLFGLSGRNFLYYSAGGKIYNMPLRGFGDEDLFEVIGRKGS